MNRVRTAVLLNGVGRLLDFEHRRFAQIRRTPQSLQQLLPVLGDFDWLRALQESIRAATYADYTDEQSARSCDRQGNAAKHRSGTQPPIRIRVDNHLGKVLLAEASRQTPVMFACHRILDHSFRVTATHKFFLDKIGLRANPSVGARHGIEVVVILNQTEFYYDCIDHALVRLGDSTHHAVNQIVFLMLLRPEVYAWRYPQSSIYLDICLDIGHALGNMRAVCFSVGQRLVTLHQLIFPVHKALDGCIPMMCVGLDTQSS